MPESVNDNTLVGLKSFRYSEFHSTMARRLSDGVEVVRNTSSTVWSHLFFFIHLASVCHMGILITLCAFDVTEEWGTETKLKPNAFSRNANLLQMLCVIHGQYIAC